MPIWLANVADRSSLVRKLESSKYCIHDTVLAEKRLQAPSLLVDTSTGLTPEVQRVDQDLDDKVSSAGPIRELARREFLPQPHITVLFTPVVAARLL